MRYLSYSCRIILLLSVFLLAGCPSLPSDTEGEIDQLTAQSAAPWLQRQQQLQDMISYQARGSFGYITDQQSSSARFLWQQIDHNNYRLLLTTPFGGKIIEMIVAPDQVTITDDKNETFTSHDAEVLLYQLTQLSIPLNNMRQWLIGLQGEYSQYTLDGQYRLKRAQLERDGVPWVVEYKSYHNKQSPELPREMELKQQNQRIKLKIDTWNLQ